MKKLLFVCLLFGFLFWDLGFKSLVAAPLDTLVGAYYPWVSYHWGYSTGVPVKNGLLSDVFDQFFIWKHLGVAELLSGHVPTWNPYVFLGTPFLATFHSALLHPANILMVLPIPWGWNLYIISSTLAAFLSMYLYLRNHVQSPIARALGSVVFALGGPMSTWSEFGTAVWAMAMLPLILWSIDTKKYKNIPVFFLALILAGNVQVLTYATGFICLYGLLILPRNNLLKLLGCLILGIGLSAIQLVPTIDLYTKSIRSEDKYVTHFNYGLNSYSQAIRLIAPDFFGHPVTNNFTSDYPYHDYSPFFGTISLVLASYAALTIIRNKFTDKTDTVFVISFLGSLFLSFDTPITRFIFSQPVPLLTFSLATRIYFLTVFSAGFLVARSFSFTSRRTYLFISLVTLALTGSFLIRHPSPVSLRNSLIPVAMLIVAVAGINPRKLVYFAFLLLISFDLVRFYRKYNPFVPARLIFPDTKITKFLQSHRDYAFVSLSKDVMPPNSWMWYKIRSFGGYDPLYLLSFNKFSQLANNQPASSTPGRFIEISSPNLTLMRLANVGYYLVKSGQPVPTGLTKLFSDEGVDVYQDPLAMPFVYEKASSRPGFKQVVFATNYDSGWKIVSSGKIYHPKPYLDTLLSAEIPANLVTNQLKITYYPNSLLVGSLLSTISLLIYAIVILIRNRQKVPN